MKNKNTMNKYLISTLILILTISFLLSGCTPKEVNTINNAVKAKQENKIKDKKNIIPNFRVKEYSNPNISFLYPANFKEDASKYLGNDNPVIFKVDNFADNEDITDNMIIIVGKLKDPKIKISEDIRKQYIDSDKELDIKVIDDKSFLNNNIAIYECINYEKGTSRIKRYFYAVGNGKYYIISISTNKDNWDNIKPIIDVFEKSLKFK